jgi:hypothetical protein
MFWIKSRTAQKEAKIKQKPRKNRKSVGIIWTNIFHLYVEILMADL